MAKRDEIKAKRRNRRKRRKAVFLFFFTLIAAGLLFGLSITVFFPIKHIEITGSNLYTAEEIESVSGISIKDNLFMVNESKTLELIQKQLTFVDSIKITKKFPDTIKINVNDSTETYLYKVDEIYYSVDKKGRILKEYTEQPNTFTYVEAESKVSGKEIKKIVIPDEKTDEVMQIINKYVDDFKYKPDYIDLSDIRAIKIGFDTRFTAELGDSSYINEKIMLLVEMMETKGQEDSGTFRLDMWTPENHKGSYFESKE